MDRSLVAVFIILNVLGKVAGRVDREYVAVAGVIVEGVAVYGIRRFLCRK